MREPASAHLRNAEQVLQYLLTLGQALGSAETLVQVAAVRDRVRAARDLLEEAQIIRADQVAEDTSMTEPRWRPLAFGHMAARASAVVRWSSGSPCKWFRWRFPEGWRDVASLELDFQVVRSHHGY